MVRVRMDSYRRTNGGADDPNAKVVDLGPITVWFSYTTPIAFQIDGQPCVVRQNDWSVTTGKHLNAVDNGDKASRIAGTEFERLLSLHAGKFFFPRDLDPSCPPEIVADWLDERGLHAAAAAVRTKEAE